MPDLMISPEDLAEMQGAMEESFDFTARVVKPGLSNDPRNPSGGAPTYGPDFRCRVVGGLMGREALYADRLQGKQAYTLLAPVGTADLSISNRVQVHEMNERIFNILGLASGQTWEVVTQVLISE